MRVDQDREQLARKVPELITHRQDASTLIGYCTAEPDTAFTDVHERGGYDRCPVWRAERDRARGEELDSGVYKRRHGLDPADLAINKPLGPALAARGA